MEELAATINEISDQVRMTADNAKEAKIKWKMQEENYHVPMRVWKR